jgi:hypothetical protein
MHESGVGTTMIDTIMDDRLERVRGRGHGQDEFGIVMYELSRRPGRTS